MILKQWSGEGGSFLLLLCILFMSTTHAFRRKSGNYFMIPLTKSSLFGAVTTTPTRRHSNSVAFHHDNIYNDDNDYIVLNLRGGSSDMDDDNGIDMDDDSSNNNHVEKDDDDDNEDNDDDDGDDDESLSDRVAAAMRRLGLNNDDDDNNDTTNKDDDTSITEEDNDMEHNSATTIPADTTTTLEDEYSTTTTTSKSKSTTITTPSLESQGVHESIIEMTRRISTELNIDESIVLAALGASRSIIYKDDGTIEEGLISESIARDMILNEINAINSVNEDLDEVQRLIKEGYESKLARRALAFADMDIEMARVILEADEEDAQEEARITAANNSISSNEEREIIHDEQPTQQQPIVPDDSFTGIGTSSSFNPLPPSQPSSTKPTTVKSINVNANFDPTKPSTTTPKTPTPKPKPDGTPPPALKKDVIFEVTSSTLRSLILNSPVPILLDVYADWCGPCKQLTPALEQMAIRAGGIFRLVKLNTDEEPSISQALGVKSLPTVFAIRNGKIVSSFMGMPNDDKMIQSFMMGLLGAGSFNPAPSEDDIIKYNDMSRMLVKMAASTEFTFAKRERLTEVISARMDKLYKTFGSFAAQDTARILKSLLNNIVRDPFEPKYRKVNLCNPIIKNKVMERKPSISILKSVGFQDVTKEGTTLVLEGTGASGIPDVAPAAVVVLALEKWMEKNRREAAMEERKLNDEKDRVRLLLEAEEVDDDDEYDEYEEEYDIDEYGSRICTIRIRMEGRKKTQDLRLGADRPLRSILEHLLPPSPLQPAVDVGGSDGEDDEKSEGEKSLLPPTPTLTKPIVRITCPAKKLTVTSDDDLTMGRTLRDLGMVPSASIVVKIENNRDSKKDKSTSSSSSSKLKERAEARRARKGGTATMQSVGIYSKDDNAKGELIDGGGGVWYEQDITTDDDDDEEEEDIVVVDGESNINGKMVEKDGDNNNDAEAEDN